MKSTCGFHASHKVGGDARHFVEVAFFVSKTGLSEVHFFGNRGDVELDARSLKIGIGETITALSKNQSMTLFPAEEVSK